MSGWGDLLRQAPLAFRGRKANLRGEHARNAVKNNYKPPPSSADAAERQPGTQLKLTELFGRHMAQQQWQPPAASALHTYVQDMDI